MAMPTYPKPNRNAEVSDVALRGRRTNSVVQTAPENMAMERPAANVNSKSSDNTANYSAQNQSRSGGRVGKIDGM